MRTTLTLDDDVVRLIDDAVHRDRRSMKQVVNDALRRALSPPAPEATEPYRLQPHRSELQPGFDLTGFNRLADEFDDAETIDRVRPGL